MCDVFLRLTHFTTVTDETFKINMFNRSDNCLVYIATCKICNSSTLLKLQTALDLGGIATNLRVESLIGMKILCKNIFTVILKVRDIMVF